MVFADFHCEWSEAIYSGLSDNSRLPRLSLDYVGTRNGYTFLATKKQIVPICKMQFKVIVAGGAGGKSPTVTPSTLTIG
jgi:hypothetical protein